MFDEPGALGFRFRAADGRGGVLIHRAFGTHSCVFGVFAKAQKFVLADGEFEAEPRQFALHVLVTMRRGENAALGIALLKRDLFERLLCFAEFRVHLRQRGLRFAHFVFELQDIGVESAEFALHAERAGFIGAAARDHAALIASAVGCNESELRIVACECFSGRGAVRQISRPQPRKKLFGGGAQGIAEAD